MTHDLKCWPDQFDAVARWDKNFELRYDDRGFRVGDTLLLRRWDPATGTYTGETVERTVTYILSAEDTVIAGVMRAGHVVMSWR